MNDDVALERIAVSNNYFLDSKRKGGDDLEINSAKSRKIERKCVDLIVLGIPWKSTEDVVRNYFEQFGEVVLCEVCSWLCGWSRFFPFIRLVWFVLLGGSVMQETESGSVWMSRIQE